MIKDQHNNHGFTIVELLVVIVVIGILASITLITYNGIQSRARLAKMNTDFSNFSLAVQMVHVNQSKTLGDIIGNYWTAGSCAAKAPGTDIAALPRTDACWTQYASALDLISNASGINVRSLVDPWARPYYIDANEGEGGTGCSKDVITIFTQPFNGGMTDPLISKSIPLSGASGCST